MHKALTIIGMVIAGLIGVLFLLDLVLGVPFKRASFMMDISFLICAAMLGYLSWATFKEQV
jgi:hypothetical protein|tara:strand:+ start:1667 stop:1849 length:183 start_codon:yes stop_codon:yes gene_type:complete